MRGRHRIYHDRSAYESIQKRLSALGRVENPRALARDISKVLVEGNRYDRFREVDRFGKPLIPWRVRRGKYKGALGPTLIPHGTGSDAIRGFFVQRADLSDGWRLTAGIRSTKEYIYGFHAEGKAGTGKKGQTTGIKRDILGITPRTRSAVFAVLKRYASQINRRTTGGYS